MNFVFPRNHSAVSPYSSMEHGCAEETRSKMAPRKIEAKASVRRLFKSRRDKIFDGVCGGIAEFLDVPSAAVRISWVLLLFVNGLGIVLYIASMILMPVNPAHKSLPRADRNRPSSELLGGLLLLFVGFCILANWASDWWDWGFPGLMPRGWWHPIPGRFIFPGLLILIGAALIARASKSGMEKGGGTIPGTVKKVEAAQGRVLTRSRTEKVIGGVCGGIGNHAGLDPTLVRILYALLTVGTGLSFGVVLYAALWIILPIQTDELPRRKQRGITKN
jgi:phage shock protein PspC (stress-responsive transcriptional regulator)